jgi:hypothetical protein
VGATIPFGEPAPFNKPEVDVSFRSPLLLMIVLV